MHFSNLATLIALLLTQHPITTSALNGARIWTHFYPDCSIDGITPGYSSTTSPTVDVPSGVCQRVDTPLRDDSKVDYLSVDAELLIIEPGTQCNVTVHEVPGCDDPPLLQTPLQNGLAHSDCVERNFITYTAVWVRLGCGQVQQALPRPTAVTRLSKEPEMPRFQSVVRRDNVVRRKIVYHV